LVGDDCDFDVVLCVECSGVQLQMEGKKKGKCEQDEGLNNIKYMTKNKIK